MAFSILEKGHVIKFVPEALVYHPPTRESWFKILNNKRRFFIDPLLFKKHPKMYKKYIKFPFELFTPFYVLFSLLGFLNPLFFFGLLGITATELFHREWRISMFEFVPFLLLQTIGSFILAVSVLYGCLKFKVNPLRFLFAR